MQFEFRKPFKSIQSLPIESLPDFTVITGANGSGKTHLLQAIMEKDIQICNVEPNKIRYYNWSTMVPADSKPVVPKEWEADRNSNCRLFAEFSHYTKKEAIYYAEESYQLILTLADLYRLWKKYGATSEFDTYNGGEEFAMFLIKDKVKLLHTLRGITSSTDFSFHPPVSEGHRRIGVNSQQAYVLLSILEASGKPLFDLSEADCHKYYPIVSGDEDAFTGALSALFAGYVRVREINDLAQVRTQRGLQAGFLSEEEFLRQYGLPPWQVINDVLYSANLSFRFREPEPDASRPMTLQLENTRSGVEVKYADLSSGERVLISLAHFLFFSQDSRQPTQMPEVILLDEVDAPLHPSMILSLLKTIENVMVKQYQRKVILVTHSPSTVALAPEESIYVLDADTKKLRKTSRDEGVRTLTVGVPILSINTANRRQIFVESTNDVGFYERITALAQPHLLPDISLSFLAGGKERNGGCALVKRVVSSLREGGNKTVFGLVDWDGHHASDEGLRVLGEGERYSIENFLLDPIPLAALLLRDRHVSRQDLGIPADHTYVDMRSYSDAELQQVADKVVRLLGIATIDTPIVTSRYSNGRSVEVPQAYFTQQGHSLETYIKTKFPGLKEYHRETDLKDEMLGKILDDLPGLLPMGFVEVLRGIQNSN